ncbi:flavin reductase family protein [Rhodococcus sp. USK13]|uniref:flavin reductase family protein n=1 Tax=Rhodococcus sp. USK13 TaxID=2806442 RepID=UPI001BD05F9F|nr:flavin reductase family protein [Rhodococcus sp. USK13]
MTSSEELRANDFRQAMRLVPTPVAIVTTTREGVAVGLTVGSFAAVSMQPAMITFFVDNSSTTWPKMRKSPTFAVNILGHDNGPLCRAFSRQGDRFADVDWAPSSTGDPVLSDASVSLQCRMHSTQQLGDHVQVVGEVTAAAVQRAALPLVYFRRDFLDLAHLVKTPVEKVRS